MNTLSATCTRYLDLPPVPTSPSCIQPSTLSQALTQAAASGLDLVDAERLLMHALGHAHGQRAWLRAHGADALSDTAKQAFDHLCLRRLSKEPMAYITGQRGFYGLDLQIDSRVLDPRPDTETLVDWALEVLNTTARPHVIDLGTGSGAIALAIQHERRDAHVTAVDASADALTVARANADRLQLAVQFVQGSWLTPIPVHPR
jgi:release factor glutamine methyltransferase